VCNPVDPSRCVVDQAAVHARRKIDEKSKIGVITMRLSLLVAFAVTAFAATMTFKATDANAVVCARGLVRAACVAARSCCGSMTEAGVVHRCRFNLC
jgi:hypothetical protein